jgi:acyl-CoA synthetase (AMP-forming)/AMP-acid ligase II
MTQQPILETMLAQPVEEYSTIASCLQSGAAAFPHKRAFCYLEDGCDTEVSYTYAALQTEVTALARYLREAGMAGHPVILLYPEGLAFIVAFLACQQAGVIAVPMFLPRGSRHMERLSHIVQNVGTRVILSTAGIADKVRAGLQGYPVYEHLHIIPTDDAALYAGPAPALLQPQTSHGVSFIQYTSGSTGTPKGVVISHDNLLHNQSLLAETFGGTADSVIFSWLPFYHDMGLIGNILHTVYLGASCILMSPLHFMQQPARWPKAIAKYRVTHSGGPNFSYDLCADKTTAEEIAQLDLSCWKVAYNGAEPVRKATIDRFAAHFAPAGFNGDAFFPCYGLAEATLLVAGVKQAPALRSLRVDRDALNRGHISVLTTGNDSNATDLVSSGKVAAGMQVRILTPADNGQEGIGEILIAGSSVSRGYWQGQADEGALASAGTFLPTGDLGFLHEGHLFVTGRKKEMLIIRGKNYYPYDIENACTAAHPAVQGHGVAAVSVLVGEQEQLVLLAEVKRTCIRDLDAAEVKIRLMNTVIEATGLVPYDIVLVGPMTIPRTSSGKLQRNKCSLLYQEGDFAKKRLDANQHPEPEPGSAGASVLEQVRVSGEAGLILQYLEELFRRRLHQRGLVLRPEDELAAIGVDSLRAMELVNTINQDLRINLEPSRVFEANTVGGLVATLEVALWVTDAKPSDQGILL